MKSEFFDALSSAEKQAHDYQSKCDALSEDFSKSGKIAINAYGFKSTCKICEILSNKKCTFCKRIWGVRVVLEIGDGGRFAHGGLG